MLVPGSKWYNELGSVMIIKEVNNNIGTFGGTYNSAVGEAEKEYLLCGRFDTAGQSLGWVVSYQNQYLNAHSTCSWSGQIQFDPVIMDVVILTNWLLTRQTSPEDDWNSTNIGHDTFTRVEPSKQQTMSAKLRCQCSHPKNA